ncbi:MAG: hypothetical protein Fur0037_00610 [Planctomycetota bacterium]
MPDPSRDLPPTDPSAWATRPFRPVARRELPVFSATAELILLPERARRQGRPDAARPPFDMPRGDRIVAEEAFWSAGGLAATPNIHPFAERQVLLWREPATREHGPDLLEPLFRWVGAIGGTGLVNSIGAAASIPRAHAHVTPERLSFLGKLREEPASEPWLPRVPGTSFVRKLVPFTLLGVRGEPRLRARAVHELNLRRSTAAWNLVVSEETAWIFPRSSVETPAPSFPHALGAAELWGRFCFLERGPFEEASGPDLERALALCGVTGAG